MFIMNQDKNVIVNLDDVFMIRTAITNPTQFDIDVWADSDFETIGTYETEERTLEVLEKIAKSIGATEVFYMPEE